MAEANRVVNLVIGGHVLTIGLQVSVIEGELVLVTRAGIVGPGGSQDVGIWRPEASLLLEGVVPRLREARDEGFELVEPDAEPVRTLAPRPPTPARRSEEGERRVVDQRPLNAARPAPAPPVRVTARRELPEISAGAAARYPEGYLRLAHTFDAGCADRASSEASARGERSAYTFPSLLEGRAASVFGLIRAPAQGITSARWTSSARLFREWVAPAGEEVQYSGSIRFAPDAFGRGFWNQAELRAYFEAVQDRLPPRF